MGGQCYTKKPTRLLWENQSNQRVGSLANNRRMDDWARHLYGSQGRSKLHEETFLSHESAMKEDAEKAQEEEEEKGWKEKSDREGEGHTLLRLPPPPPPPLRPP